MNNNKKSRNTKNITKSSNKSIVQKTKVQATKSNNKPKHNTTTQKQLQSKYSVQSGVDVKRAFVISVAVVATALLLFFILLGTGVLSSNRAITGDTSPDAVEHRIRKLLPKADYETMFPARFGTDKWKQLNY